MLRVILYTSENCSLCEEALSLLKMFQYDYSFEIEERDINIKDEWLVEYLVLIPVIEMNGKQLNGEQINYETLEQVLQENT